MFIKNTKYIAKFENKNIHTRILGAIFSFLVSIVTFVGYINNINSSDTASLLIVAIMFIVSITFGLYFLYSFQKINTKGQQIFREFYKKFLAEKNNSTTITSLKKQKNLIKEMQEISGQVFGIPERKSINYDEELKRINESVENFKKSGKITSYEYVYAIAERIFENIENTKTIIPSENLLKNQELFLHTNNKNGKPILASIIFFGLSTIIAHVFQQTTLGIICMCCGIWIFIWNFVKNYTVDEYKFAKFLENISKYFYLIEGAREYYKLSLKEKGNLPELSLLFGDIVTILSQNISERKNLILEYKKVWNYIVSPFPFARRKLPEEVEIFLNEQQQKIVQDSIDLQKFILLWRESEVQKLQSLHIEQEIPELALQSKRREILLQNLQKLG